ncbi:MAG: hypothetical protein WC659_02030 [Patescibacteria group bacterium]
MFDDIDFLAPQSEKGKPRRRLPTKQEIDLKYPNVHKSVPFMQILKKFFQDLRRPTSKKTHPIPALRIVPEPEEPIRKIKLPPPPRSPRPAPPNPLAMFVHKFFTRKPKLPLPSAPALPQKAEQKSPSLPTPPPSSAPPIAPVPAPLMAPSPPLLRPEPQVAPPSPKNATLSTPLEEKKSALVDVNLLPSHGRTNISFENLVTLFIGVGILIIFVMGGVTVWYRYHASTLERDIHMKLQEISSIERDLGIRTDVLNRALVFHEKSNAVGALLKKHTHWLKLLAFIEQHTSQELFYDSFQANPDGTVNLKAQAKSYNAVAEQVISFMRVPEIRKIVVSPVEVKDKSETGGKTVIVDFVVSVDPKIILPRYQNATESLSP